MESSFKPETIGWECDCLCMTSAHSSSWAMFVYALIIYDFPEHFFSTLEHREA